MRWGPTNGAVGRGPTRLTHPQPSHPSKCGVGDGPAAYVSRSGSVLASYLTRYSAQVASGVRELVGLQRFRPYDHPLHAGLIFSLRPDDIVQDVSRAGCIIAYGNVRHIWRR